MKLSEELQARGFIHQHTGESLAEVLDGEKRTIYHGIDPSADSAHAGNMVIWFLLRHLANAGHRIIFLVGGGTGMIGDPKPDAERVLQDVSITDGNVEKIKAQAQRLIGGDNVAVTFVNNKDWLAAEGLLTFLRDIGKHFTVNELIKKDAISKRLASDTGISYTEFAYPLLQGYDYLVLNRQYGADVQVGGSDQWGNIVAGVDLIRRKEQKTVHAITVPLIVDKATGKKFGKSEGNAVWLDAEKTTPFNFYQFWLNVSDENVIDYLKVFTFLSLDTIAALEREVSENPGARKAQKELAFAVTSFVHSTEVATSVANVALIIFGGGTITALSQNEREILL
ncbi:tyrosine--tRNA ligase, partial [Patescibacteria group bacterium]|nr:tyrosine--tRNA ligase [Patescibacteria group bacterium]